MSQYLLLFCGVEPLTKKYSDTLHFTVHVIQPTRTTRRLYTKWSRTTSQRKSIMAAQIVARLPKSFHYWCQMISFRFVVKPEGVSNVLLTKPVGSMRTWGLRGTRGGVNPPPPTNRALQMSLTSQPGKQWMHLTSYPGYTSSHWTSHWMSFIVNVPVLSKSAGHSKMRVSIFSLYPVSIIH